MMQILLVVLVSAKPSPPCASLPAFSEAPPAPNYGGLAALAVGGLSLTARLRRR